MEIISNEVFEKITRIETRVKVRAGLKVAINYITEAKFRVWVKLILFVYLFGPLKLADLDHIKLGGEELNVEYLKRFFLLDAILLTLTKFFFK